MPYFSPAPSLALAAVHRPPLRSKGLGDILACWTSFPPKALTPGALALCPFSRPQASPHHPDGNKTG